MSQGDGMLTEMEARYKAFAENMQEPSYEKGCCNWWMGRLSELIKVGEEGRIPKYHSPAAQPHRGCNLYGALQFLVSVKGCLPLIHGPIGCVSAYRTLFCFWGPSIGIPVTSFLCTAMNEKDVIFGAEEKLAKAILKADEVCQPELIAVLATCPSGIIGDDVKAVARGLKGKVRAKLTTVDCPGFAYKNQAKGIDEAFMSLIEDVMEPPAVKRPLTVNLFVEKFADEPDFAYPSDPAVLRGHLEAIGLKINASIAGGCTVEQIRRAPEAELNIVRCVGSGLRPARRAHELFGQPWMVPPVPEGFGATTEWLRQISDYFGGEVKRKAEEFVTFKTKQIRDELKDYLPLLKGKRVAVFAGVGRTPSLAALCADLEMEVVYLSCIGLRERTFQNFKWFYEKYGQDPEVVIEPDMYFDEAILNRLKPDLWLADFVQLVVGMGSSVPTFGIMAYIPPHLGFDGIPNLVMGMIAAMNNPLNREGQRIRPLDNAALSYLKNSHPGSHPVGRCCMNEFVKVIQ